MRLIFPKKACKREGTKMTLNIWHLYFWCDLDYRGYHPGWYAVTFGILKITEQPIEGTVISKSQRKGFLLNWRFWLPFEKGR